MEEQIKLSPLHRIMLQGLITREKEIMDKYMQPIRDDYKSVFEEIEKAYNLESGSIASQYDINIDTWTLQRRPTIEKEEK